MHPDPAATPEPDSPAQAVLLMAMQVGRRMRMRYPDDQIDAATFPLLHALRCHDGMRLSDLAQQLSLDASTVSRHVRQLEDRGLLERTDDPDDRRAALLRVSAAGIGVLRDGMERRKQRIAGALDDWPADDVRTFQRLLTRFAADLTSTTQSGDLA